jgi:hypothetical protein
MRVAWRGLRRSWNRASAPYSLGRSAIWCPSPKCSPRGVCHLKQMLLGSEIPNFRKGLSLKSSVSNVFSLENRMLSLSLQWRSPRRGMFKLKHSYCGTAVPLLELARHSQHQHEGGRNTQSMQLVAVRPQRALPNISMLPGEKPPTQPEVGGIKMTTRKGEVIAFAFWLILFVGPARADQVQYSVDINTSAIQRHFRATRLRFPSPAALKRVVCKEPHICAKSLRPDGVSSAAWGRVRKCDFD